MRWFRASQDAMLVVGSCAVKTQLHTIARRGFCDNTDHVDSVFRAASVLQAI
jgi:hypothetical protein